MSAADGGGGGGGGSRTHSPAPDGDNESLRTLKRMHALALQTGKLQQKLETAEARIRALGEKGISAIGGTEEHEEYRLITDRNRELTEQIARAEREYQEIIQSSSERSQRDFAAPFDGGGRRGGGWAAGGRNSRPAPPKWVEGALFFGHRAEARAERLTACMGQGRVDDERAPLRPGGR